MTITTTTARSGRLIPRALGAVAVPWYAYGLVQCGLSFAAERGGEGPTTPLAVWALYAVASGAGLVGAGFLLALKFGAAVRAFGVSLGSALGYYGWIYGLAGSAALRPTEEAIIGAVVVSVTTGLFLFSRSRA